MPETILVTGAAGFIGAFLCKSLLETTENNIIGLDNCNDYYDPGIKEDRLKMLAEAAGDKTKAHGLDSFSCSRFSFVRGDLANEKTVNEVFDSSQPSVVVNLGAQAGVRYSIENPRAYVDSNLIGFFNILEACRNHPVKHLVYASSSSVYGGNKKVPFSEEDRVDSPVSLYAATKKSNELMANAYSKLYSIPATGLRFFTVYGPMGRPDMAYFGFTNKLVKGETIKIFNMGNCMRDFTYVDDIVEGIKRVMENPPTVKIGEDGLPLAAHRIYNIGNSNPENLLDFVDTLQRVLVEEGVLPDDFDFSAHRELVPMQPGDVPVTFADTSALERDTGFKPSTPLETGLREFAKWYKGYYLK
jgi:UDP-glucuronate 4-epimerase